MIVCNKCGAENAQNAKFCVSCGHPLRSVSQATNTTHSSQQEDQNVEINVNLDFAKKGIDTFKTLSKNQQVMAGFVFVAIIVFFFMKIIGGQGEGIGFYEIIQEAKENGGKEAMSIARYIWLFLLNPVIIGALIYSYNFHYRSLLQKLKILLGINFVATMMFTVLLLIWFGKSGLTDMVTSSYSRYSIDFFLGFYLYLFSFIGIITISSIEIINLFRRRK